MSGLQHLRHNGVDLAYRHITGAGPLIVFLHGYMSDMTGSKAEALADWAVVQGRACLRLDYSGCGASGGDFLDGSIGRWTSDALAVIDHVAPGAPVLLVGSSMGGWIALRLGLALGDRLAGLAGIAAAPDFTDWGLDINAAEAAQLAAQGWFARPTRIMTRRAIAIHGPCWMMRRRSGCSAARLPSRHRCGCCTGSRTMQCPGR
jgi:pimeloyl-ACP methyl ester carboxylesterase